MQQPSEPTTISGKPITFPVAFRLTSTYYQKLKEWAEKEGKTVSELLQEWVIERLTDEAVER